MLPSALVLCLSLFAGLGCAAGPGSESSLGRGVSPFFNVSGKPRGTMSPVDFNDLFALEARQGGRRCSVPGGPECADGIHCCSPGEHCCDSGAYCCDDGENCLLSKCCPEASITCGDTTCCRPDAVCCSQSPTGCCVPGGVCCSEFSPCCEPGDICEQGECISEELKNKVVRFELDEEKNGDLLRNMCNGMRGKNTETLTYSGPANTPELKAAKARKRRLAGCKDGFCRTNGDATRNSCDEFPPASSDEGGDARDPGLRAITCIPQDQNTFQGTEFSRMMRASKLQKGDKWVISIDCTKVLKSFIPREAISTSGSRGTIYHSAFGNNSTGFIIVPFGDLDAGSYSATIQLTSGSSTSAVVINNEGDNLTTEFPGINSTQHQQFNFEVEEDEVGVGIVINTKNNKTKLTWTFNGTTSPVTNSTTGVVPSSTSGPANGTLPTSSALRIVAASLAVLTTSSLFVYFSLISPLL